MRHSFRWWEAFWKWLTDQPIPERFVREWFTIKKKEFEEITRTVPRWWEKPAESLTLPPKPREVN